MKLDNLLNIIIPLDFGLKGRNEELRRGVKLMMVVLVVAAIVVSSVSVTLAVCPEGATGWYVWVMVAWWIFLHTIVYCVLIGILLSSKGSLKELINGPASSLPDKAVKSYQPCEEDDPFFSPLIDEDALIEYIKANPDSFTCGEDMALFYIIMRDSGYSRASMRRFHDFLSSKIECRGYGQLSQGCLKVKERLGYHSMDETRKRLVIKYEKMEKLLQRFVVQAADAQDSPPSVES